ncbi:protocatechuate dioxygenase [Rhodococcus sp. PvR099]|uniref:protocatechuate dioxygenase n=1 Tax=Rhodococcus sp. PvR099 TaxID=2806602 RepID=UPI001AE61742|nr:protocatechuate dioxygenase [Rhodococcus sp. PvR099]MBP1161777.1 protocatechuate 3,4-dioxygenase beta subunit [Rhodococcus sp. PvR099]
MNEDIERSRARVSRRRALALGGTVGLSGLIAACTGNGSGGTTTSASASATGTAVTASGDVTALLARAPQCVMTTEETQGPYWFDVDSIRNDLREDRPGATLDLAIRVQDLQKCTPDGSGGEVANAVVEIWHCDAGGVYSGFESGSQGANGAPPEGGPGGPPEGGKGRPPEGGPGGAGGSVPGGNATDYSDGSYSKGDSESATTDDGTYLRGAQTTDADGIARFTTIFPGWYQGRTTHIHLKVHVDKATVLTSQLYFEEALIDEVYASAPYDEHTGRENNVDNAGDGIFDESGMVTAVRDGDGYLGAINIGV